ncbi:hypothetical protein BKA24_002118 [Microbacterium marinum]|uniref:Phosphodiesterase n=1 Tax=Microbacterium marinum TaxID=421115 RepID=A0A7W7BRC9_9MICO|nr:hypothetical protein [Microbacterium marinum]MBB4667409.1 hypothetical protein [Microbacterium marinum]
MIGREGSRGADAAPLLARAGGGILRAAFVALRLFRRPRPIHPRGVLLEGTVRWTSRQDASGIRWIDDPADADVARVTARFSRSVGLPSALPDVLGLAIRTETTDGWADIELASTGARFPWRFTLRPARRPSSANLGSLIPYRGRHGAVLIIARPLSPALPPASDAIARILSREPWRLRLHHATTHGAWSPFAVLELRTATDQSDAIRFDAGRHLVPGARMYRWIRALRQPSYDAVQNQK